MALACLRVSLREFLSGSARLSESFFCVRACKTVQHILDRIKCCLCAREMHSPRRNQTIEKSHVLRPRDNIFSSTSRDVLVRELCAAAGCWRTAAVCPGANLSRVAVWLLHRALVLFYGSLMLLSHTLCLSCLFVPSQLLHDVPLIAMCVRSFRMP